MKLFISLLLLMAVSAFGAQPSYQAFRGTGGITIVSNPPTGTIVIDGSAITSPTGGVSAATATNISQYFVTNSTGRPADPNFGVQYQSNGVMQASAGMIFTNGNFISSNIWDISSVKYWGALGNAAADDTPAFELAISNATARSIGTVFVPAGTYLIKRPIRLPSNITLRGVGFASKITKAASTKVVLTNNYSAGVFAVTVSDVTGFAVGGSIYLTDTTSFEWLSSQATITNITGNTITFNLPIDGALQTARGAYASTSFPMVRNNTELTTNIVIRDLCLDHNKSANDPINDFTVGTIHYEGNFGGMVDNVWLLNAPTDAYSDQATNGLSGFTPTAAYIRHTANTIQNSHIKFANRHGVHLGTCMDGAFVLNNDIQNCGGFAEFYCAFVTYTTSMGNLIDSCNYGFAGIDQRDYGNIISGNALRNCTNYGIDLSSSGADGTGGKCTISGNSILGFFGIVIDQPDCVISDNVIQSAPSYNGIEIKSNADRTALLGNVLFSPGGGGSTGIQLVNADDCRLIGNTINGYQSLINIQGASRLSASANTLRNSLSTYWNFNGAASTNIVIKNEVNIAANPVTESTVPVRLVYEGYGDNGGADPATSGNWNGVTDKMFNGTFARWTNSVSTNLSVFVDGRWFRLLNGTHATLTTTATLDFPQLEFGGATDLPVTLTGVADGDVCEVAPPVASIGPVNVIYTAFASNNTVYVRCASYATAQDPASGVFRVVAKKFQ